MSMGMVLEPLQELKVTVIIDNVADLIAQGNEVAERRPIFTGDRVTPPLLAEHGLSIFISATTTGGESRHILLDAGLTEEGLLYNLKRMDLPLDRTDMMVLSHGHFDHFGALKRLYQEGVVPRNTPLLLHPKAFCQRGIRDPQGGLHPFPRLEKDELEALGVEILESRDPSLQLGGVMLVTGEIPRQTPFEVGFPMGYRLEKGEAVRDDIPDDQALAFMVKGKGIVAVLGCGHSGVINTLDHISSLTKENRIHAVIGGFHLSGAVFEESIVPTIHRLKEKEVRWVVPTHCTGFKAQCRFAKEMPQQFIYCCLGTTFRFSAC